MEHLNEHISAIATLLDEYGYERRSLKNPHSGRMSPRYTERVDSLLREKASFRTSTH